MIPSPRAVKRLIRTAARSVGQRVEILKAGTERNIDTVFARMIDMRVDALLVAPHADPGSATDRASGTPCNTDVVLATRVRRGWWPHELRIKPCRRVSRGRRLRRSHPQRREAA